MKKLKYCDLAKGENHKPMQPIQKGKLILTRDIKMMTALLVAV